MTISFDPAKSQRNAIERGLPFTLVEDLVWETALIEPDTRKDYGEPRYRVLGLIGGRLYALAFTPRAGKIHVISLRKANRREIKRYVQT